MSRRRGGRSGQLGAIGAAALIAVATGVAAGGSAVDAAPALAIAPITWDVIGLDSNDVATGPNTFPVGGRVCNSGTGSATSVDVRFAWDGPNPYIDLEHQPLIAIGTVAAGACRDVYFNVVVQRTSAAFDTTRSYHLEALIGGAVVASTPTPRQLYIERLVSQNRNSVDAITGPGGSTPVTDLEVGDVVTYELHGGTATNGYEQLEVYVNFPNAVFQVLELDAVYTGPAGGTNDSVYADACGWEPDPTSPNYLTCVGPETWGGKAGGDVVLVYRLAVVGAGDGTVFGLIHDFSGSSFHYNADFGQDGLTFVARDRTTTTTLRSTIAPSTSAPPTTAPTGPTTTPVPGVDLSITTTTVSPTIPTPDPGDELPETGPSSSTTVGVAALLVALGVLARRAARRPAPVPRR